MDSNDKKSIEKFTNIFLTKTVIKLLAYSSSEFKYIKKGLIEWGQAILQRHHKVKNLA